MPRYDYDCSACKHRFEVMHGVFVAGPTTCPNCGSDLIRKAFAAPAVHFKGTGWAKKERRASVSTGAGKAASEGGSEPGGTGPSDKSASDDGSSDPAPSDKGSSDKSSSDKGSSSPGSGAKGGRTDGSGKGGRDRSGPSSGPAPAASTTAGTD